MDQNKKSGLSLGQVLVLVLCAGILVKCMADNSAEKARKQAVEQVLTGVIQANENVIKRLESERSSRQSRSEDPDEVMRREAKARQTPDWVRSANEDFLRHMMKEQVERERR